MNIRRATADDAGRIAEILVFNNRINFFPIFKDEYYSFCEMQVTNLIPDIVSNLANTYVYDDGVLRGVAVVSGDELFKLYVDPMFQSRGFGKALLEFVTEEKGVTWLWALEKNIRALAFYEHNGFTRTGEKVFEDGTTEYLVKMIKA